MEQSAIDAFMQNVEAAIAEGGCACSPGKPHKVHSVREGQHALYVGMTERDLRVRMREHLRREVKWTDRTEAIECTCFQSLAEALVAELELIGKECPEFNIRDVPEACRTMRLIDALAGGSLNG